MLERIGTISDVGLAGHRGLLRPPLHALRHPLRDPFAEALARLGGGEGDSGDKHGHKQADHGGVPRSLRIQLS